MDSAMICKRVMLKSKRLISPLELNPRYLELKRRTSSPMSETPSLAEILSRMLLIMMVRLNAYGQKKVMICLMSG